MYARTSTWSGSPEALRLWAENATIRVKGFVEGLPGNSGVVFLVDRDSGTALTLTLWDSEEAANASDQFAEQSREATVAATGTELVAPILQREYLPRAIAGERINQRGTYPAIRSPSGGAA